MGREVQGQPGAETLGVCGGRMQRRKFSGEPGWEEWGGWAAGDLKGRRAGASSGTIASPKGHTWRLPGFDGALPPTRSISLGSFLNLMMAPTQVQRPTPRPQTPHKPPPGPSLYSQAGPWVLGSLRQGDMRPIREHWQRRCASELGLCNNIPQAGGSSHRDLFSHRPGSWMPKVKV